MRGDESGVLTAQSGLGRRSLLRGSFFGVAGLAAVSLVGCGDEDEPSSAVGTYATVRQYENVQNAGAVIEEVNASFLPLMKEIPGFVAYYFMDVGDDGGRMVSVSVFEDESGALESNRRAAEWVLDHPNLIPPATLAEEGRVAVG